MIAVPPFLVAHARYASCEAEQEPEDDDDEDDTEDRAKVIVPVKKDSKLTYQKLTSSEATQSNLTYRAYHVQDEPYVQSSLYYDGAVKPQDDDADRMTFTEECDVVRQMMKRTHRSMQRNQKVSKPWRHQSSSKQLGSLWALKHQK